MKPLAIALTSLAIALGAASASNAAIIRFGSVADFEPYNYLDDDGELRGFEADLAVLICARASLNCEWALAPWDDMIVELLADQFDVIMTGMQITADRELIIDFTEEYFPADPSAVIARSGEGYPSGVSVVAAQVDTLQADYVTSEGFALSTYPTPEDALAGLLANEVSAFVGDQAYLEGVIAENPGMFDLVATEIVIGGGIGLGIRESSPTLLGNLNTAIASLKADGTLDALIGTWFNGRDPNYRGAP